MAAQQERDNMRILLVDDEPVARRVLAEILQELGPVDAFAATAPAVEAFRTALAEGRRYTLSCIDLMLGQERGERLIEQLREIEAADGIGADERSCILAVSACVDTAVVDGAYRSFCDGYLAKPVRRADIYEQLHRFDLVGESLAVEADWQDAVIRPDSAAIAVPAETLALAATYSEVATLLVDDLGVVVWCNDAWTLLADDRARDLIGQGFQGYMEQKCANQMDPFLLTSLMDPKTPSGGSLMLTWNGPQGSRWIRGEIQFGRDGTGRTYFIVQMRDVTQYKRSEDALRKAHNETELLLSSIAALLIGIDRDGTVIRWNRVAERVFGIASSEVINCPLADIDIPWDRAVVGRLMDRSLSQAKRIDEVSFVDAGGQRRTYQVTAHRLSPNGSDKAFSGWILLGTDVTEQKHLLVQLGHAQKMESIGQLAAGIAHEINTPIQFIGDNLRFLQEGFDDLLTAVDELASLARAVADGTASPEAAATALATLADADPEFLTEEVPGAIKQSLEGVDRVARIVSAMKDFSHPGGEDRKPSDLNACVENTLTIARNEYKYVADALTDLAADLPPVVCDPAQINQVLLNLVVNAAHAIADTVAGSDRRGEIRVRTWCDGESAHLEVGDSGCGIPEEIRKHVFDPFFTTKEVGKGTGQGLAIVHDIVVVKHHGSIDLQSELGQGTSFHISLPLQPPLIEVAQ